ncbi:MAG: hypothetical protein JNL21_28775 [Myxococcales bacterium]|nr:hypothetical protein [Myxococcales bacterium]
MTRRRAPFLLSLFTLAGCAQAPSGLSSHTVQVGPAQEVDVVWIQKGGQVYRCTGSGGRPVCEHVPTD